MTTCPYHDYGKTLCAAHNQGYTCTRPEGHVGNHVACGNITHNIHTWRTHEVNTIDTYKKGKVEIGNSHLGALSDSHDGLYLSIERDTWGLKGAVVHLDEDQARDLIDTITRHLDKVVAARLAREDEERARRKAQKAKHVRQAAQNLAQDILQGDDVDVALTEFHATVAAF